MHSSQVPSTVVNIESVRLGSPESRTTLTAAATAVLTEPVEPSEPEGATEKAISMLPSLGPKVRCVAWPPLEKQVTAAFAGAIVKPWKSVR